MSEYLLNDPVVVVERHHPLAYEEGTVNRPEPDDFGRIRVDFVVSGGDNGSGKTWSAIELASLAPLPQVGERRRWLSGDLVARFPSGPFTLTERGTTEERLYTIRYDDALYADGIASAAELARYSELYTEPDGAQDGTTGETRVVVEKPRGYGKRAANLDTLRDIVLEAALSWEEVSPGPSSSADAPEWHALCEAIRAYRTARDS